MGKFNDISALVHAALVAHTNLTDLLTRTTDGIYPVIADQNAGKKYVVYFIDYERAATKDSKFDFSITIISYATNYNDTVTLADEVTEAFRAAPDVYTEQSGTPQLNEQNEFYITQTFNIKK